MAAPPGPGSAWPKSTPGSCEDDDDETMSIPLLNENEKLHLNDVKGEQKFTQPPPRFSEASLVKAFSHKNPTLLDFCDTP